MHLLDIRYPVIDLAIVNINSSQNIEAYLSSFVRWALQVTASGEYSGIPAMELLEQAWQVQQLVWRLREEQICDSLS